jgi:hypothetical protein
MNLWGFRSFHVLSMLRNAIKYWRK